MKILVVGNGAREHAIVEKLSEDSDVYAVMSKNNPAISRIAKKTWICDIENPEDVKKAVDGTEFDLGFSSPDGTLAAGVSDALEEMGMKIASPTKSASRIEWDKSFMRNLMKKYSIHGLPKIFLASTHDEAGFALDSLGDVAIKPLGLTGGKGVRLSGEHFTEDLEMISYCDELIGKDGKVLIEEKLSGEEFTLQAFSDGNSIALMPPVQDHKRAYVREEGPNTGGMGSYSTGRILPFLEDSDLDNAEKILQDVVDALRSEGAPFKGVLYGQFMATSDGIKVIEFNARFGDPEAMNVITLLESSLSDVFLSISEGSLRKPVFSEDSTVVKYLVPSWYPGSPPDYTTNTLISVDHEAIENAGAKIYYASVYGEDGRLHLTNSRSFGILSKKPSLEEAESSAESACGKLKGPLRHRPDIGTKNLVQKKIDHMNFIRGRHL